MTSDTLRAFANWKTTLILAGAVVWGTACQQETGERQTAASARQAEAAAEQEGSAAAPPVESPDDASPPSGTGNSDTTLASRSEHAEDSQTGSEPVAVKTIEQPPEPLLQDWDKPQLAIVLTGEQHGRLEPCGCSEKQSGGLARRTDFVKQLRDRGWPVTGFDLGGTLQRTRRQSEMKFEYTRDALDIMGYKGLGLGPEELKLGVLKLFESFSRTQADESFDVPFISANVTFFGERGVGTPLEYRVVEVNGVKIGVTSIIGQTFQEEMYPSGSEPDPDELKIESVDDVLPGVIERMRAELGPPGDGRQVMILLSHAKPEESERLAQQYPVFDLVVTAGSPEDPDGRAERIGDTLLLKVGEKGKHAGLVGLYPSGFRFTTVELDRFRFGNAAEIDELMEQYQKLLEEENLIANEPAVRHPFGEGYEYLGSEKCGECHDTEYEIWESTPHSHAFDSLTVAYAQASDDPSMAARVRVDRIHDPECVNCHSTGWDAQDVLRFETGFTGRESTPHLMHVHCENCHGPGSKHVALEESGAADELLQAERDKLHLSIDTAEVQLCIKCHDYENSPDFNFDTYWPQIEH